MRVSVCLRAILIPEYVDIHSGYSAPGPRTRVARIYSGIYSYSGISQTNAPLMFIGINLKSQTPKNETPPNLYRFRSYHLN